MTGIKTVQKATFNHSGSRMAPILDHINATVEQVERPLMTPDEVMRLRPARKEGEGDAERIVEAGDMLIFVSGHFPIYGRQLLYFLDPELVKRVKEQPPTQFKAIENGQPVEQRPLNRTLHVMSRPEMIGETDTGEVATAETAHTHVAVATATASAPHVTPPKHGFIEQLELDRRVHPPDTGPERKEL